MILYFVIDSRTAEERGGQIRALISYAVPGSSTEIDVGGGTISVTLPAGADAREAEEKIVYALTREGIYAAPRINVGKEMPPIMPQKKKRTVKLSTFIVSLIAMALAVATLTVFVMGVISFDPLDLFLIGNDATLGTGDQEGEDYAQKIALVDRIFEEFSYYDTDGQLLLDEMLKAYAAATGDRYAAYYTDAEFKAMNGENNAELVGIGVSAVKQDGTQNILITQVFPSSPAAAAGLLPGDMIVALGEDEAPITDFNAAIEQIRGKAGTEAVFTVRREGESDRLYRVTRAAVQTVSVDGRISQTDPKVGIVRITQFNIVTPVQFRAVMEGLIAQGCEQFVFDVRNNPGGDLKSIIAVLAFFLHQGDTVVTTVAKDGSSEVYKLNPVTYTGQYEDCSIAKDDIGRYREYKKAVLTNGNTASAAELFTAVLSDYGLATTVGEVTFGKGIIQSIISLEPWGYKGAVKLTTGRYDPPVSGNYDGKGIEPQVRAVLTGEAASKNLFLLSESEDAQLLAAITEVKK